MMFFRCEEFPPYFPNHLFLEHCAFLISCDDGTAVMLLSLDHLFPMRAFRRMNFQQIATTWVAAQIEALLFGNGSRKQ